MLPNACLRGPIVDISSITINTFLMAVMKPLGRTLLLQLKNNLWSFFRHSPWKPCRALDLKSLCVVPSETTRNQQLQCQWILEKLYGIGRKWGIITNGLGARISTNSWNGWNALFPPDTWQDSLYVSGTEYYIGISVPGSLPSVSGWAEL